MKLSVCVGNLFQSQNGDKNLFVACSILSKHDFRFFKIKTIFTILSQNYPQCECTQYIWSFLT